MPTFRTAIHPAAATIPPMLDPAATFDRLPDAAGVALRETTVEDTGAGQPASLAGNLDLAIVTDTGALDLLAADWNALYRRSAASHNVFQAHAWLSTWARHFTGKGARLELAVVTGRRAGRLVTVWPLALKRVGGLRQLEWAGMPVSQYGDVLLDRLPDAQAVIDRTWTFVTSVLHPDLAHLRKVRADAAIAPLLARAGFYGCDPQRAPAMDFGTTPDFARYEQRYSAKARKNRRRLWRRLEEQGEVRCQHLAPGPEASELAARAIGMKRAWLAHRGLLSPALDCHRVAAFFRDACATSTGPGAPQVSALTLNGAPLAIMVAVTAGDRVAGHIFTYDLAFEKSGAGVLLLEECLRHACATGHRIYDLLAPADDYKSDWADHAVDVADYTLALSSRGRLFDRIYLGMIRPLGREFLMRRAKRRARVQPCANEA